MDFDYNLRVLKKKMHKFINAKFYCHYCKMSFYKLSQIKMHKTTYSHRKNKFGLLDNYVINPETNCKIKVGGVIYNQLKTKTNITF
jgi:hypothetical protein